MIQLKFLSGNKAGDSWVARRFPVRIGRSPACELQADENGLWDQHLDLDFVPREGIKLKAHADAVTTVNGQPVQEAVLRNGDIIQAGGLRLQFWLSEARQRGQGFREGLIWTGIAAVTLVQIGLIYWLMR
jgi:pSer/pThr/pTyr-binding forkhead associated (FHA) protein